MRSSFIVSMLLFTSLAFADTTPAPTPTPAPSAPADNCKVLRQAKATVAVSKVSWSQNQGIWEATTEPVAKSFNELPVVQRYVGYGCSVSNLLQVSDVILNGVAQSGSINADLNIYNTPTPHKNFYVSYYVPAQGGSNTWAQASNLDPNTKNISLSLGTVAATHQEFLQIVISFEDDNAQ